MKRTTVVATITLVAALSASGVAPSAAESAPEAPVDRVVFVMPVPDPGMPASQLALQLDDQASASSVEAELEKTFGPLTTSTDGHGTLHATESAARVPRPVNR